MCMDCNVKMSKRRVEAVRAERWAAEAAKFEFVAVYGKTTHTAATFVEIGDLLVVEGFLMAEAETIAPHTVRVPHSNGRRASAAIRRVEKA